MHHHHKRRSSWATDTMFRTLPVCSGQPHSSSSSNNNHPLLPINLLMLRLVMFDYNTTIRRVVQLRDLQVVAVLAVVLSEPLRTRAASHSTWHLFVMGTLDGPIPRDWRRLKDMYKGQIDWFNCCNNFNTIGSPTVLSMDFPPKIGNAPLMKFKIYSKSWKPRLTRCFHESSPPPPPLCCPRRPPCPPYGSKFWGI